MSTIRFDSVGPPAGGTTFSTRGVAKAWVNLDGTSAISIRDSENVSSLTDNGAGNYTINFTNVFDAANLSTTASATQNLSSDERIKIQTVATGSQQVQNITGSSVFNDTGLVCAHMMGDLA